VTSQADRLQVNTDIANATAGGCCACLPCFAPRPVQALDIQVRDGFRANAIVAGAVVIVGAAGVEIFNGVTDAFGDVIVRLPAGAYDIVAAKEWFLPQPAARNAVAVGANQLVVVQLDLQELRYFVRVDADRDGDVDFRHEGLNVVPGWQWGAGNRGAIILCNSDHDDGLPAAQRRRDNEDAAIAGGNDATHEIAVLQIFRDGPATAPPADWQARLQIVGGKESRIRIFAGTAAASPQILGAATPGAAAVGTHTFALRTAVPASLATQNLGMEATCFPAAGFNGIVALVLTVSKNAQAIVPGGSHVLSYYTGAEVRVAPWMMPNHLDEADTVYVADLGADQLDVLNRIIAGNATFRNDLTIALAGAVPAPTEYAPGDPDPWMQDCMEIGYSVFPKNDGAGGARHRIDVVMQAHRYDNAFDLAEYPRTLLGADYGFQVTAAASDALTVALTVPPGHSSRLFTSARDQALVRLIIEAVAGNLLPDFTVAAALVESGIIGGGNPLVPLAAAPNVPATVAAAAAAAATAVENAVRNLGSLAGTQADGEATLAVQNLGAPFNANAVDANVATAAVIGANKALRVATATASTTLDSTGNLECTPPCRSNPAVGVAKDYPWGRIYFGDVVGGIRFNPDVRQFLEGQIVQAPIALDTSWLHVGHVDEMMTFVPDLNGPAERRWRLVVASPQVAFSLMDALPALTPILTNRFMLDENDNFYDVSSTVGDLRNGNVVSNIPDGTGAGTLDGAALRLLNLGTVQPAITAAINVLVQEIGVVAADVIHIPVIFIPGETDDVFGALTADMVNMLVVGNHLVIPQPFGPVVNVNTLVAGVNVPANGDVFMAVTASLLTTANAALQIRWIDDWYTYHVVLGEVHCGTNTRRRPANAAAWLATPAAEWWRYVP
jgi:hypothetical protein